MKIKGYITSIVLVLAVFLPRQVCADDAPEREEIKELFAAGNGCYESGDYAGAINEYRKIIDSGYESANVYYNLGNAYFRSKETAKAIANYERAERLDPDDSDLVANRKFVQMSVGIPPSSAGGIWGWMPLKKYRDNLTLDEIIIAASVSYAIALIVLAMGICSRHRIKHFVIPVILLFAFSSFNIFVVVNKASESGSQAVVLNPDVESYYGPFDSATVFFKLREGMIVKVMSRKEGWCKVRRSDGKSGWVRAEDIESI